MLISKAIKYKSKSNNIDYEHRMAFFRYLCKVGTDYSRSSIMKSYDFEGTIIVEIIFKEHNLAIYADMYSKKHPECNYYDLCNVIRNWQKEELIKASYRSWNRNDVDAVCVVYSNKFSTFYEYYKQVPNRVLKLISKSPLSNEYNKSDQPINPVLFDHTPKRKVWKDEKKIFRYVCRLCSPAKSDANFSIDITSTKHIYDITLVLDYSHAGVAARIRYSKYFVSDNYTKKLFMKWKKFGIMSENESRTQVTIHITNETMNSNYLNIVPKTIINNLVRGYKEEYNKQLIENHIPFVKYEVRNLDEILKMNNE